MLDPKAMLSPERHLALDPQRTTRPLFVAAFLLAAASLVAHLLSPGPPAADGWVAFLDVGSEQNLPTWFSANCLLGVALAAALAARTRRAAGAPGAFAWCGFALCFVYLSLDEAVAIHERTREPLLGAGMGVLAALAAAAAIPGLLFARGAFRLWRVLSRGARRTIVLGVVVFLLGAAGLEIASSLLWRHAGASLVLTTLEELFEMWGALLVLRGVLVDVADQVHVAAGRR